MPKMRLGDGLDGDAHAFLMAVYKDKLQPTELRLHAARAAIGYEKPPLTAVESTTDRGPTLADCWSG